MTYTYTMKQLSHFLQYHNAVPLAIAILVLGTGSAFAATNPAAIYASQQTAVSVDNSYIANKDLTTWTPTAAITSVTEDSDNYYVQYRLTTIDIVDAVWRDVTKDQVMTVAKSFLGPYRDLGVYVTSQLEENIAHENTRLAATQSIEKAHVTQKVVATTYSGLVGKMMDERTETLPGYTPVITEVRQTDSPRIGSDGGSASAPTLGFAAGIIQPLGNVPALVAMGSSYVDLGAVITDARYEKYGVRVKVNDTEVSDVSISTATTSDTLVTYYVTDGAQILSSVDRHVIVYDPAQGVPNIPQQQATAATPAAPQNSVVVSPSNPVSTSTADLQSASTTSTVVIPDVATSTP